MCVESDECMFCDVRKQHWCYRVNHHWWWPDSRRQLRSFEYMEASVIVIRDGLQQASKQNMEADSTIIIIIAGMPLTGA